MSEEGVRLERELPRRVVVVGDLNGHGALLIRILRGLHLIKADHHWSGGKTVLVQMGDVPNRGPAPRTAMELLLELQDEAREAGGDVVWLLGNHEVLSALRHEAYVTPEEYLEFATPDETDIFIQERTRFQYQFLGLPRTTGGVPPMTGLLRAWEEQHAPGKEQYRASMGAGGRFGKAIRRLPIALRFGSLLFVHGGLSPKWAEHGIEGLHKIAARTWGEKPAYYEDLDPRSVLRDPLGPLWNRVYCLASVDRVMSDLTESLDHVGAKQMIVGHTRTDAAPGGRVGRPLVRHRGRLVMCDVGLGEPGDPGSVLVIDRGKIEAWTPGGSKSKLVDIKR